MFLWADIFKESILLSFTTRLLKHIPAIYISIFSIEHNNSRSHRPRREAKKEKEKKKKNSCPDLTLTIKVAAPNMLGVSTPLRYALISGIPGPAAVGANITQRADANAVQDQIHTHEVEKPSHIPYLQQGTTLCISLMYQATVHISDT